MGRNHFSRAGGPYFINDGFSHHSENLNKPSIKPDQKLFYSIVTGFVIGLVIIARFLYSL